MESQISGKAEPVENERDERIKKPTTANDHMVVKLMQLKSIGEVGAYALILEFFGWRKFRNAKEVGAAAGLAPTPYSSGNSQRDQGISKTGNSRIRSLMIELAWLWLRWQPDSALSKWFANYTSNGSKRQRETGIVAVARKLLIALWKYLEKGIVPEGAIFKETKRQRPSKKGVQAAVAAAAAIAATA